MSPKTHRVSKPQTVSGKLYAQGSRDVDLRELEARLEPETGVMMGKHWEQKCRQTLALWLTDKGATYSYAGKTRAHIEAPPLVKEMARKLQAKVLEQTGVQQEFNTAIFTRYLPPSKEKPSDKGDLNWHDDESRSNLKKDSVVGSVVFGEARGVFLRRKADHKEQQVLRPGDGEYYVMLPGCQRDWQHRVEKGKGVRTTLTFRTVESGEKKK